MLSLLAPAALAGALLLAIPVAIHLFKPRKVRVTSFSSLRWLNLSKQKLARRIQWHQLLLFFVRAAFILMLVFALARPLFTPGGKTAGVDRFVILDVSRSMGYQPAAPTDGKSDVQQSPLDRAKAVAATLLTQSKQDDRVTLILSDGRSRSLGPLIHDGQIYERQLNTLVATQGRTDLSSALETLRPMLPPDQDNRAIELHFLTDNHLQSWNQGVINQFVTSTHRPITVNLVDVSSPNANNAYIAQVRRVLTASATQGEPPVQSLRVSVGYAGIGQAKRNVTLDAIAGVPVQSQNVTLEAGSTQWLEFRLPASQSNIDADKEGQIARISLDPADGLSTDDTAYIHLDTQGATQLLIVDTSTGQNATNKDTLHLRAAVEALNIATQGSMVITRRTPNQLTPQDIETAQVILLANVPSLSPDQLTSMQQRIKMGAGMAVFLGPQVDMNFYNQSMYNPIDPAASLMPYRLGTLKPSSMVQSELPRMTDVVWSHPLFESLYDPILGDLPQTRFIKQFQVDENLDDVTGHARVLARIGGQTPAIIEQPFGAGKVILLNLTADDSWSDLPRRKSFLPWMDQLIQYLAGGQVQRQFEVLTPVALLLPASASPATTGSTGSQQAAAFTAVSSDGVSYPTVAQQVGVRTMVRLDGVRMPGVYNMLDASGQQVTTFIAQADANDSRITSADTQIIRQWWEPASLTVLTPGDAVRAIQNKTASVKLWPWLIALGGLLLIVEMYLVHYLCPRMNPTLATSVIETHKGIIAPLESASARSVS